MTMQISVIQAALNARGHEPPLRCDGVPGRKTMMAVDATVAATITGWQDWPDARRMVAIEQIILRDAGIEVGTIDGLVGEQMRYARDVYAARLRGDKSIETWRDADQPLPAGKQDHAQAWPRQKDVPAFFGEVGRNQVSIDLPFPFRIAWAPDQTISRVSCHKKVAAPLARIWARARDHYGYDHIKELRLDMFGGCLNVRKMRGGSAYSMHAWGIAWDVDPDRNQLKWGRRLASLDAPAYDAFWTFVEAEGAASLGRARDYDWMHFQFARL